MTCPVERTTERWPRGSGPGLASDTVRCGLGTVLALTAGLAHAGCGGEDSAASTPSDAYAGESTVTTSAPGPALHFTEVTRDAGVDFVHISGAFGEKWMPETMGSGGGFFDYDGDGWPDIFLVNGAEWPGYETRSEAPAPALYRNRRDGTFEEVSRRSGLERVRAYGMGVAFADYDADGDVDVYVTAVGDNLLLRNDEGRFRDVAARLGVSGNAPGPGSPPAWSTGAAWVDVDRDGWLDLFVCNYVRWTPETDIFTTLDGTTKAYATPQPYRGESCRLYRNLAGRRFEDVTVRAGVHNPDGKSLGVAVEDLDDDGWPDLVVANDTERNFLYRNQGDGTFIDVALRAGVGYDEFGRARAGMGIDVAEAVEIDRLSIAIGNFSREPVSLFTQIQDDLFHDLAGTAGITDATLPTLTFGLVFADLDLDGRLDLVLANGHIEPEISSVQRDIAFAQPMQILRNEGGGRLRDITDRVGAPVTEPVVGRGLAVADYDRDGDPDLLLTVNGGPPRLLRNDLPTGPGWLRVRLEGRAPNREAIGAVITLWVGETRQRRMVRTGSSYLSQSEANPVLFGLGEAPKADSAIVRWPVSGDTTRLGALEGGREHRVREHAPGVVAR